MDEKKILYYESLQRPDGGQNSNLIGSMLINQDILAAMSRADKLPLDSIICRILFLRDEFQSFANESFLGILSEARKYKLKSDHNSSIY